MNGSTSQTMTQGTRVMVTRMPNDPDPVPPGTRGTIRGLGTNHVMVDWDNGRRLILLDGVDEWTVVTEEPSDGPVPEG